MNPATLLSRWRRLVAAPDIALDVGTAYTRVAEPLSGEILEVASTAHGWGAGGRAPVKAGVVADVDAAAAMCAPLVQRFRRRHILAPRVLACAPSAATSRERAALREAALRAGAGAVAIVPEPLAAAVGAGVDVAAPHAALLVDVGAGVTDIAVVRAGELVATAALRSGCLDLYRTIGDWMRQSFDAPIDPADIERAARQLGVSAARPTARGRLRGASHRRGRHADRIVSTEDLAAASEPWMRLVSAGVEQLLARLPTQSVAQVAENGLCVTGGGARVPGVVAELARRTGLPARAARDPLRAVIVGAREMVRVAAVTGLWRTEEFWPVPSGPIADAAEGADAPSESALSRDQDRGAAGATRIRARR